ncbi:MAG TPA: group 1 glycosyl transferase, partial [Fibrella sp.]
MNILIPTFLTGTSPSGVVTYYQTLARDLRSRGTSVQVVETTDTPFLWNKTLNIMGHVFRRMGQTSRILWDESSYFVRLYLGVRQ